MRKLLLLFILFLGYAGRTSASTWKIGPNGNFADINAAMNSASVKDGDVLRIMDNATIGSTSTSQTVTKSVTIEGPGIVVNNSNGNVETASYIASDLYLQETGIVISKLYLTGTVYIRADEITVEKCWIKADVNGAQQNYDTENFTLRQCYLQNCTLRGLNSEDHPGWRIMNNIFVSSSTSAGLSPQISGMYDAVIDHNIFYMMYKAGYSADYIIKFVEDCTITNNIITKFVLNSDNTVSAVSDKIMRDDLFNSNTITNNVFTGTMSKANNKGGISSITDVYTGKLLEGLKYPETEYMLSANSLARNYATDGGNCGPWDGQYPYLLGGLSDPTVIPADEFQVEANDLLALKNMYNAFGGDKWTTKKWSFASNGKSKEDFPGVTFNDQGRVTAIDLLENGLDGEMFNVYSPSFAELTRLNLGYNKLRGDISKFVINLPKLQTLFLQCNRLTEMSQGLPKSCVNLNLQFQNRPWGVSGNYVTDNFYSLSPIKYTVRMDNYDYVNVPSLFTFGKAQCTITTANGYGFGNYVATMLLRTTDNYLRFYPTDNKIIYTLPQDTICIFWQTGEDFTMNSAYPILMHFAPGDADMNGVTNVLDVQYTLTYILAASTITTFNYSAANTYSDSQINVQDIVATVNIMLSPATPEDYSSSAPEPIVLEPSVNIVPSVMTSRADELSGQHEQEPAEGTVFSRNGQLLLSATRPVAAIDVELEGVSTDEVGLMLPSRDFQMIGRNTEWGSRYVIFSTTGKSLPADTETPLLRLAAYAQPVGIMCADPEAKSVAVAIGSTPTGISVIENGKLNTENGLYDLQGRRMESSNLNSQSSNHRKGLYIQNGKKIIFQ